TGYTYTWNPGAINGASISVTPSVSTTYTVSGTQTGCIVASTNTVAINVYALPTVSATTSNTLICAGQNATLTATGANTYAWLPTGSGASIVVSPTVNATYTVTGTNTVTGCSNSSIVTQNVSACTGINNIAANNSFNVFPNPNNGKFMIELPADAQVEITNTLGEVVFSQLMKKGNQNINLASSSKGIYFIKVGINGKSTTNKIIVE
ncbi:MAG TPA: T9SS type A sorting domain-containing protein, partial [Bacteroidia bacterium]|nr:T9SS type A sorting domain-containing protein [Bacteroidia bacterium]